jgi:dipeptidyl aminopeptidase/acylaminoacyl peptidase
VAAPSADLQKRLDFAATHSLYHLRIKDTRVSPQWLQEGERFIYWSAVGPHAGTWVEVEAATGSAAALIRPSELEAKLGPGPGLNDPPFKIAPNQKDILFQARGGTFLLERATGAVTRLPEHDPRALAFSDQHTFSPDNRFDAVSESGALALRDARGRVLARRQGAQHFGWQVPPGAWSPDSRHLVAWRVDERAVHKIPIVDYSQPLERVETAPYAKAGTAIARQELHIFDTAGHAVHLPLPDSEGYAWLAGWRPDGSEALVLHLSRDGKTLRLFAARPRQERLRLVLTETRPATFVGDLNFVVEGWQLQVWPLKDNRRFLWMSERDGWRHVYLYAYDGTLQRQVTRGNFPVHRVVAVAPDMEAAYVIASGDETAPYDRLLYAAGLSSASLRRLSKDAGWHDVTFSPSGRHYADGHSTLTQPRRWDVCATDGTSASTYAEADVQRLAEMHYTPPEAFEALAADGKTVLHGVLYKPWDFDARRRYAVIDYIYGGPFTAEVPRTFAGTASGGLANGLSQMGFITMVLDARGTPGRSKAFHDANYGRIGQNEIPDHVAVLRQLASARPYMDLGRAGIHGHSWGGYFTLRGMLTAPDFFKAGYAGAPGALEEEAVINEPNLGLPRLNPEGYRLGSNELAAGRLAGALRIMHGTADINAPLATSMRMAEALIKAGKHFELLIMPGQDHNPWGPPGRYYLDDTFLFFLRTLGEPSPPKD